MDPATERIQYLTKKAQRGVVTQAEREELAVLLELNPQEFQGSKGLAMLILIALAAIAAAVIIAILSGGRR